MICNIKRRASGGVEVGTLDVGSVIQIAVDGIMKNFIVVQQGLPTGDATYDAANDGTWILMEKCSGYTGGQSEAYPGYVSKLSQAAQSALLTPNLTTGYSSNVTEKLFALSTFEQGWKLYRSGAGPLGDGNALEYFKDANTYYSRLVVMDANGTAVEYWTRSKYYGRDTYYKVGASGWKTSTKSTLLDSRWAGILDKNTLVTKNSDGTYTLA